MHQDITLHEDILAALCCPDCKKKLTREGSFFVCTHPDCQNRFAIVDGIPVLLSTSSSVFSVETVTAEEKNLPAPIEKLKELVLKIIPSFDVNVSAQRNFTEFSDLVLRNTESPKVLVLGGGILGVGLKEVMDRTPITFIETDVFIGPRSMLVCDAHDIPFEDALFDAVVVQAVLEHVLDPQRCVAEIYRVLKHDGLVYAETPFMQPVHMGRYDFTRFSHLGHRRLFRNFKEIRSGTTGGPGTALAWSYKYFLLSFVTARFARFFINVFTTLTSFWLKYFDYYLQKRPGSLDAAAGYYFIGRKSRQVLSDKELITSYKGCFR